MAASSGEADDLDLKYLLNEWNLGHHYKYFLEQKISPQVLTILKPHHVEKLFKNLPIGDMVMFEHKLELWKLKRFTFRNTCSKLETNNATSTTTKEVNNKPKNSPMQEEIVETRTTAVIVPQVSVAPQISVVPQISVAPQISVTPQVPTTPIQMPSAARKTVDHPKQHYFSDHSTATPSGSKPTPSALTQVTYQSNKPGMILVSVRYNLRTILEETSGGQMIMSYYEKHKILREEHRSALINVIARYIDANGHGLSLAESNQIEEQIVELFPTEKCEFYRTNRRGRIYNKVANMKRIYKKFSMLPEPPLNPSLENSLNSPPSSPSDGIKQEGQELYDDYSLSEWRSETHTPEEYLQFWKNTQKLRLKHIEDIESLAQILEKWPEYKQQNAVEYIHLDFMAKNPEATKFAEVFYKNKTKIEKLLYSKVSVCSAGYKYLQQYQKCSYESQNLIILWVMHQLFPPNQKTVVDESGNKRKKRYSIQYSQNAFICIRNSMSSLEQALQVQLCPSSPPMVLIVGELGGDIDQIFVYFEGVRFPMDSVVSAAQLVCELFFLFDLDYPEEAELFYYFVQTFFLNMESEIRNHKIYTVINEINTN